MLVTLLLSALTLTPTAQAGTPATKDLPAAGSVVKVTATTVVGLRPTSIVATAENAWATFPSSYGGKTITATVKCKNGGSCSVFNGTTKIGSATIIKVQTGGFVLNSSLSEGGTSWVVEATWKPAADISAAILTP